MKSDLNYPSKYYFVHFNNFIFCKSIHLHDKCSLYAGYREKMPFQISDKKKVLSFYAIKMNQRFGKAKTYIVAKCQKQYRVGKSYLILFYPIPLYTCIINAYLSSRIYTVVKKSRRTADCSVHVITFLMHCKEGQG